MYIDILITGVESDMPLNLCNVFLPHYIIIEKYIGKNYTYIYFKTLLKCLYVFIIYKIPAFASKI